jgi:hypothetical protein
MQINIVGLRNIGSSITRALQGTVSENGILFRTDAAIKDDVIFWERNDLSQDG